MAIERGDSLTWRQALHEASEVAAMFGRNFAEAWRETRPEEVHVPLAPRLVEIFRWCPTFEPTHEATLGDRLDLMANLGLLAGHAIYHDVVERGRRFRQRADAIADYLIETKMPALQADIERMRQEAKDAPERS